MELKTRMIGAVMVVQAPGPNLETSNVGEFKAAMAPILSEHRKVVFDLSDLQFMDSSGIGAMLSCLRQLNQVGGDLKLCNLRKSVRSLFELVRMHRVFDLVGTVDEAVAAMK